MDGPSVDPFVIQRGDLIIDRTAWAVTWRGLEVNLTRQTFTLLYHLASHPGRVFTRDQLLGQCWDWGAMVGPKTVEVHVCLMRQLMAQVTGCRITTVRNVGYRWDWAADASMAQTFPRQLPQHAGPIIEACV